MSTGPLLKELHEISKDREEPALGERLTSLLSKEEQADTYEKVSQCWFVDDSAAVGNLAGIKKWWQRLQESGPKYGYFPNPSKCILIAKDEKTSNDAKL